MFYLSFCYFKIKSKDNTITAQDKEKQKKEKPFQRQVPKKKKKILKKEDKNRTFPKQTQGIQQKAHKTT
jgi:hypothetical protein